MRWLSAAAVVFSMVALPVCAQRGGVRGGAGGHAAGGFHGGTAMHVGSGFRGGYAGYGRPGFAASPRFGGRAARYSGAGASRYVGAPAGYRNGVSSARPVFYNRNGAGFAGANGERRRYPERGTGNRYRGGYGGYGYSGGLFFDPFLTAYFDGPDWFDDGQFVAPAGDFAAYAGDPGPYAGDAGPYAAVQGQRFSGPSAEQQGSQTRGVVAAQPLEEEDAVTIVFRDGRPSEQIRNYALTRTALYLTGRHIREIPLGDIDLPATEKVNREAGVDFRVPQAP